MKEYTRVRQIPGEQLRRWFHSDNLDLVVWFDAASGAITGFELAYDKQRNERCVRWRKDDGFAHMSVDDGEDRPGKYKATPILLPDGVFEAERIVAEFELAAADMPEDIAGYVLERLRAYPDARSGVRDAPTGSAVARHSHRNA